MDRGSTSSVFSYYRSQLYEMVDDPSTDSIVSWSESGKSFIVWDEEKFREAGRPRVRLERLGFSKSEQGEYSCDYFVRGQPELKPPEYTCRAPRKDLVGTEDSSNHGKDLIPLSSLSCSKEMYAIVRRLRPSPWIPPPLFASQVYEMVNDPSTDSVVSWSESGKSFIVWNESEFLRDVLPRFLDFLIYETMTSFNRWILAMGYWKVEGSEQWEYAGHYLVRGEPLEPEVIPPHIISGGFMISPEFGRRMERSFAYWKARNQ